MAAEETNTFVAFLITVYISRFFNHSSPTMIRWHDSTKISNEMAGFSFFFCITVRVIFFFLLLLDIDVDHPDKKLVIMYLTSLYHGLREYSPQGGRKRRKLDVNLPFLIMLGTVYL